MHLISFKGDVHIKNGIHVFVAYENGKAFFIQFFRYAKYDVGRWEEPEIAALLSANASGPPWHRLGESETFTDEQVRHYETFYAEPDGETIVPLLATWWRDPARNNYLEITTTEFIQRNLKAAQDKQDKEAKQKFSGF